MGGAPAQTGVNFGVIRRLYDGARPDGKNKMDDQKPAPVKLSFSHVGLHCVDLPRMVDFYATRAKGLVTERYMQEVRAAQLPKGEGE